jgi:hypothetical protein
MSTVAEKQSHAGRRLMHTFTFALTWASRFSCASCVTFSHVRVSAYVPACGEPQSWYMSDRIMTPYNDNHEQSVGVCVCLVDS